MKVCLPVTDEGMVGRRWGRADRVAVAEVTSGEVSSWQEIDVRWSDLHDQGSEGSHHARVATFLMEHGIDVVVADHMGEGMLRMLRTMGIGVRLGAGGDARAAARAVG